MCVNLAIINQLFSSATTPIESHVYGYIADFLMNSSYEPMDVFLDKHLMLMEFYR
jgi:hypothetical protein